MSQRSVAFERLRGFVHATRQWAMSRRANRIATERPIPRGIWRDGRPMFQPLETRRMLAAGITVGTPYLVPRQDLHDVNGFLSEPTAGDPLQIALDFLNENRSVLGLEKGDVFNPFVTDLYTEPDTGLTHIYLRQQLNGLEIANANLAINVTADGRLLNVSGGFVSGALELVGSSTFASAMAARLAPERALQAVSGLGLASSFSSAFITAPDMPANSAVLIAPDLSLDPIPTRLQYLATPSGLSLAWNYVLRTPDGDHWYDLNIDSASGEIVGVDDWVEHAIYNVLPQPVENPSDGSRSLLTDPFDPTASPFGWHDTDGIAGAEYTDTRGNNAYAQEDTNADDTGGTRPSGGASLNFDFLMDLSKAPSSYQSAAITNLFYWTNLLHDIHYKYGFTETAGNFQFNNYGNGGTGGDPVIADAQDGSGTNNANMATPRDGQSPRMQMYIFTSPNPNRDGDLDNGIIIHEYGHGVSNRLTGGPSNASALDALQSGGMGEGWSDWWALMLLQRPSDTQNQAMPIGTYALGQTSSGAGFRRYPYSYNMSVNPLTLGTFNASSEVHDAGEIWCAALWDLNWNLINKYGFNANTSAGYAPGAAGNILALKLVMDALKIQPANPTFLDARDAILQADLVLTGGQNRAEIWQAFARRGMGFSASAGTDANSSTVVEAFDLPNTDPVVSSSTPTSQVVSPVTQVDFKFTEPMDTSSFSVGSDVNSFTGPGAVNLLPQITGFSWVDAQTLRISFAAQTTVGSYSISIGPHILAADNGHAMNQDKDGTSGEAGQDAYIGTFTINNGFRYIAEPTTYENLDLVPSGSGVVKILDGVDDSAVSIPLGANTFSFYGTTYTGTNQLYVSSNGFITFGGSTVSNSALNTDLTSAPTYPTISPLWDDYVTNQSGSGNLNDSVLYRFDTANNRLIIEWNAVRIYGYSSSEDMTFQAILQLNTGASPGVITFNYGDLSVASPVFDNGVEATVGIKDAGAQGINRVLVSYNAGTLGSGQAIRLDVNAVNEAPTLTSISDLAGATEDTAFTITYAALAAAANEADLDGDPISFLVQAVTTGTLTKNGVEVVTGSTTLGVGEQLVWLPGPPNSNGTINAFTVRAFDKILTSSSAVQVRVVTAPVNDRPSFVAGNPATVNEDAGAQSVSNWATFSAGPANESAQVATYIVSNVSNSSLFSAGPFISASGTLTYTPANNANGTSTFTVTVSDGGGTASGGVDTSVTQTFTLTVNAVNDRPTFSASNPSAVVENSGAQTLAVWASFSAGPANESGQSVLSYTVNNISNASLFSVAPSIATNGTLTYTPASNASGTSTFDVVVRDNGGTSLGGIDTSFVQTFTITVNTAAPSLSVSDASVTEGDSGTKTATFTLSLSHASVQTVTVTADTADGTATAGSDYVAVVGQLVTFNPGDLTKTVSVTINGDTTFEGNETFFLNLSNATNAPILDAQGLATITNDDLAPTITIDDVTLTEDDSGTQNATFTLTLSAASTITANVLVNTANGTATSGSDYTAIVNQLVTFNPGETTKTVTVVVNGDATFETDETFFVNLTSPTNATILDSQGVGTINNNDSMPTISVDDVSVAEGNSGTTNATFTLTLSAASGVAVTVTANTANATALAGSDYAAVVGQLVTFNPGQTSKTVTVLVNGDTTFESTETFTLNLTNPTGATIADAQGIGTITNDDTVPAISVNDVAISEGDSGTKTLTFTISLNAASDSPVSVTADTADSTAFAGSDYVAVVGQVVTFNPGDLSKTVSVTINGDTTPELHEAFFLNLTSPSGGTIADAQGVGTINDDDNPTFSIDDVTISEGNSGTKTATFTVTLNGPNSGTVTVTANTADGSAAAGSDYVGVANQLLTFTTGQTSKTVTVTINGDTTPESDETFFVNLTNPTNALIADAQGVGTITNDDAAPTIAIDDVSISEGNAGTSNATFTLTMSSALGIPATVTVNTANGSATSGSDYNAIVGQVVTFNAGETSKTVTVVINSDTLYETTENFFVNLSNATVATIADPQGIGTINNDDSAPTVSINDVTVTEGNSGTANATFTITLSTISGLAASVNVGTANGTAASGSDYVGIANQLITFNPGEVSQTVTVLVNGDGTYELNETFSVNLSGPSNVTISDSQGLGTINNDDAPPTISVSDVTVTEGNSGTTQATFTLTLSTAIGIAASVTVSTTDGTANAGSDYAGIGGQLVTFNPGETSKTVTVFVTGETLFEPDESFTLNLSGATNATIADAQGIGTITNDDAPPPVAHTPSVTNASTNEDTPSAGGLVVSRNALDGSEVTDFKVTGITGGTLYLNNGVTVIANGTYVSFTEGAKGLRFTPALNLNSPSGTFRFSVQASLSPSDAGLGGSVVTATIAVTPVNDAPSFAGSLVPTASEDSSAVSLANWASFTPGGGADEASQTVLSYNISNVSNPALFAAAPAIATNGTLAYLPAANANGVSTFVVSVTDSGGVSPGVNTSASQTFTVSISAVNDAPSFIAANPTPSNEDSGVIAITGWATFNPGGGADESTQSAAAYAVSSVSNSALFATLPSVSTNGTLTYAPALNANGVSTFAVAVTDSGPASPGANTSAKQTFTITINNVNDAPSFVAADPPPSLEDSGEVTVAHWSSFNPGGGSDESAQTAIYNIKFVSNLTLFADGPTIDADGTLIYTPSENVSGISTFTVSVTDSGGSANSGVNTSSTQTFTITVVSVNDQPSFAATSPAAVDEDAGPVTIASWAVFNPGGGTDELIQTVASYNVSNISNTALFASLPTIGTNGTLSFTPAANANGTSTFTVSVTDSGGTANSGVNTSITKTFTISVSALNDAPSFSASNPPAINEDGPAVTLTNWASFFAGGGPDEAGQSVAAYHVANVSDPALFALEPTIDASGTLSYQFAANANGSATFTVSVSDSGDAPGVDTSTTQTFTLSVNAVNDQPSFSAVDPAVVNEDAGALTIANWAHFSPGGGADEASQTVLGYTVAGVTNSALFTTPPSIDVEGTLRYEPAPDANGSATFTVSVRDSGGTSPGMDTSVTQTFTLSVNAVNDAPSFQRGPNVVTFDTAGVNTYPNWASGFSVGPANEAAQTLTAILSGFNAALFAVAPTLDAATRTLNFTPAPGAFGATTITVTLHDSGGVSDDGVDTFVETFTLAIGRQFQTVNRKPQKTTATDADGTTATFSLTGNGLGSIIPRVGGSFDLTLADTDSKSALTITTDKTGDAQFDLRSIAVANLSGTASLSKIAAKTTRLHGPLTISGTVGTISLSGVAHGGTWTIGNPLTSKGTVSLSLGDVTDLSINSATPIKSLTAVEWVDGSGVIDNITAPWIGTVRTTGIKADPSRGNFEAGLTLSGIGAAKSIALGSLSAAGSIAKGDWVIAGSIGPITAASTGPLWRVGSEASPVGIIQSITTKIANLSGEIHARAINTVKAKGDLDHATWVLTQPPSAAQKSLGTLTVGGTIRDSSIRAAGNIKSVTARAMEDSTLFAGVKATVAALPDSLSDFDSLASILARLTLTGPASGPSFARSLVAAGKITKVTLKTVDPDNNGSATGFAADTISFLSRTGGATLTALDAANDNHDPTLGDDYFVRTL